MRVLIFSVLIFISLLVGREDISDKVLFFSKSKLLQNPNIKLKNIIIKNIHKVDDRWNAYVLKIDVFYQGKDVSFGDVVFSDGRLIAQDFIDVGNYASIKAQYSSLFGDEYYNKDNLISGSSKSKHKIVVFSDPMCPYCQELLPKLVKHANKNPKEIALYYYHFPLLSIHPTADTASKAMIVAQQRGIKDMFVKIYGSKISSSLSKEEVLEEVNDALDLEGNKKITMKDIEKEKIVNMEKRDISIASELLINGTPTVYIDGIKDNTVVKYLQFGKK